MSTRTPEQDRAIGRTLQALVNHAQEHLVLLQQSRYCLWVIVKKHPTDPTKWPPAPRWPSERWVVWQPGLAGESMYLKATGTFSDMQRPQGRTPHLREAYQWRNEDNAVLFAERIGRGACVLPYQAAIERMVGVTVEEAAAESTATSDALVAEVDATTMSHGEEVVDAAE